MGKRAWMSLSVTRNDFWCCTVTTIPVTICYTLTAISFRMCIQHGVTSNASPRVIWVFMHMFVALSSCSSSALPLILALTSRLLPSSCVLILGGILSSYVVRTQSYTGLNEKNYYGLQPTQILTTSLTFARTLSLTVGVLVSVSNLYQRHARSLTGT